MKEQAGGKEKLRDETKNSKESPQVQIWDMSVLLEIDMPEVVSTCGQH